VVRDRIAVIHEVMKVMKEVKETYNRFKRDLLWVQIRCHTAPYMK